MFETQDKGFGLGKWVYAFFVLMAIYGVSTLFPRTPWIARLGLLLAGIGIGIAKAKIKKARREL